ncbi:MAG: hypothetical protein WEB62_05085 [Bacteroidota bacterium]
MVIFLIGVGLFFGVAVYAGINGMRDLRELLTGAKKKDKRVGL